MRLSTPLYADSEREEAEKKRTALIETSPPFDASDIMGRSQKAGAAELARQGPNGLILQLLRVFETPISGVKHELFKTAILFIVGWTNDMLLYYLVCGGEGVRGLPLGGMWGLRVIKRQEEVYSKHQDEQ